MPLAVMGGLAIGGAIAGGVASHNAAQAMKGAANQANRDQQGYDARNEAALSPYKTMGRNAASQLAYLTGEADPMADTSGINASLTGAGTSQDALHTALKMGDPRVSTSAEMTKQWDAQGIPYQIVNGIAVRSDMGQGGGNPAYSSTAGGAGSLLHQFTGADLPNDP